MFQAPEWIVNGGPIHHRKWNWLDLQVAVRFHGFCLVVALLEIVLFVVGATCAS
jgi:hypothetical protein